MTFIIKEVPDGTDLAKEQIDLDYQFRSKDGTVVTIGQSSLIMDDDGGAAQDGSLFMIKTHKYAAELIYAMLQIANAPNATKRDELINNMGLRMHRYVNTKED